MVEMQGSPIGALGCQIFFWSQPQGWFCACLEQPDTFGFFPDKSFSFLFLNTLQKKNGIYLILVKVYVVLFNLIFYSHCV